MFFPVFHAVFSDHQVKMHRLRCPCGWENKFSENRHCIPLFLIKIYERVKWLLWQGQTLEAIKQLYLVLLKTELLNARFKMQRLIKYITHNEGYIINYVKRKRTELPCTSQLAETSVYAIIHQRQKHQRMRWTRQGAHPLLQIRSSIFFRDLEPGLVWSMLLFPTRQKVFTSPIPFIFLIKNSLRSRIVTLPKRKDHT